MNHIPKLNILAIETSTDACSVALLHGTEIISATHTEAKKHTQILLNMIDDLLLQVGLSIRDCDCLAFGCGPGSFTGVRIASSVIQGFGLATSLPIVPVSTLRCIAQAAYRQTNVTQVLALLDARMQQFYGGLFKLDENKIMQKCGEEFLKSEMECENLLAELNKNIDIVKPNIEQAESTLWQTYACLPDAHDIATIAGFEFELGHVISATQIDPIYLRAPVK